MDELILTRKTMPAFAHLIPPTLQEDVLHEDLVGVGMYDAEYRQSMGVILCREWNDWMEIVWIAVDPRYSGIAIGSAMLRNRILDARYRGAVQGVFAELPQGADDRLKRLFLTQNFAEQTVETDSYATTLSALEDVAPLWRAPDAQNVRPLRKTEGAQRSELTGLIRLDSRAVPLPDPMHWDDYDGDMSAVYLTDGKVSGLLLVSTAENRIALPLLWATSSHAILPLLSHAARTAKTRFSPETRLWIATVNKGGEQLVRKLLPFAEPLSLLQMQYAF